jgi:hypothetical protein
VDGGGRSFATSADTVFDPALIEWLSRADLFAHEVGMGVHTPLEALQSLPATTREKLRLIHYSDDVGEAGLRLEQGVPVTLGG